MENETFWYSIEQGHSPIDPFFKMLLNQQKFSTIATFNCLDKQDIDKLCDGMQRYIADLTMENQNY